MQEALSQREGGGAERALAAALREDAGSIARRAARMAAEILPVGHAGRRELARRYVARIVELARLLDSFGADASRLFGESARRLASDRQAEGLTIGEALHEVASLREAVLLTWIEQRAPITPSGAGLLGEAFCEAASQTGEVFLAHARAEGAGFQEAALLETIVHHLDEAILVVEADGVVSYATPAVSRILGLPPRAFVGAGQDRLAELLRQLDARDADGEPLEPSSMPQAIALYERRSAQLGAVRIRRPHGGDAVLELTAAPVFDDDGELRGAVLTVRDRTEHHRQIEALEEAQDRLRQMYGRVLTRSRLEAVGARAGRTARPPTPPPTATP